MTRLNCATNKLEGCTVNCSRGGGPLVSVLVLYSFDLSSNLTKVLGFNYIKLFENIKMKGKWSGDILIL